MVEQSGGSEGSSTPRYIPGRSEGRILLEPSGLSTNMISARTDEGGDEPFRYGPGTSLNQHRDRILQIDDGLPQELMVLTNSSLSHLNESSSNLLPKI